MLHFDQRPLVDFHAAVYYSNLHRARSLRHVVGFLLDVGLGTVLGILFGRLWAWYSQARIAMDQTVATSLPGMVTKTPAYLHARGVLLMNLILQMALTVGMFVVAYALLRVDVWINPLPLVPGAGHVDQGPAGQSSAACRSGARGLVGLLQPTH